MENIDDAWSLSFVRNYVKKHMVYDVTFGSTIGGVYLFGKTHAWVYGGVLDLVGWSKRHAHLLSTAFIGASLLIWLRILSRLRYARTLQLPFACLFLLLEPFVRAAHEARPDAMTLCLMSLTLLLCVSEWYGSAALLAMITTETHPMGVLSWFYMAAFVCSVGPAWMRPPSRLWRRLGALLGGTVLGMAYYGVLHLPHLDQLSTVMQLSTDLEDRTINNFLFDYFFMTRYLRHVPEFLVLLFALGIFWHKRSSREEPFVLWSLGWLLLSTLLIRRPNFHYALFVFPAFVLLLSSVLVRMQWVAWGLVLLLAIQLPQYGARWYVNRGYDSAQFVAAVQAALPADGRPVVGPPEAWFATLDRDFYYVNHPQTLADLGLQDFYFIEASGRLEAPLPHRLQELTERYERSPITTWVMHKDPVAVWWMRQRVTGGPLTPQ